MEYGSAFLLIMMCIFVLFSHWFACIWYTIGYHEAKGPIESRAEYGWLRYMDRVSGRNCISNTNDSDLSPECQNSAYITALYFTMTSLTSIGFGNVSANTDLEKLFVIVMMIIGCNYFIYYLYYNLIF